MPASRLQGPVPPRYQLATDPPKTGAPISMQQAQDFLEESEALAAVVDPLDGAGFATETLFKGWTIDDVIGHLHMFNHAAGLTATDADAFARFFAPVGQELAKGRSLREIQVGWLDGLSGRRLYDTWRHTCREVAEIYSDIDPKARLKWAGPDMSARSSITARQMETWAHGQEVFDVLGVERRDWDRIRNIAHLGVSTYGWTFMNRGEDVPEPAPYVRLQAPSGATWEWNEPQDDNRVEGTATAFCQVVTQVRNVADTALATTGDTARRWMEVAQSFAGPPEPPPAPGSRYRATP